MAQDVDLSAFRHATWGGPQGTDHVAFLGKDMANATFSWSFATDPGGTVAFTLVNAPAGMEGMSASYDPAYLHPVSGTPVGATILIPQIDEATLESLADPFPEGADIVLTHTLYVTREDGLKHAEFAGRFTIAQGAPN